ADHRQLDVVHKLDHSVGRVRYAPDEIAGAGTLTTAVGGHPVGTGAEVVSNTSDVDRAQRVVGGGIGQRTNQSFDHQAGQRITPVRPIQRDPQDRAVSAYAHRTLGIGRVG